MPEIFGGNGAAVTVRGTQSFVNVMSSVWQRSSLAVLEILWRWMVGAPIIALVFLEAQHVARHVTLNTAALEAMTVFQPVAAFQTIDAAMAVLVPAVRPIMLWLLPAAAAAWLLVAAFGRTLVLRRLDCSLQARPLALLLLGTLRASVLASVWMLWLGLFMQAGKIAISGPAAHGGEPDIVLYAAILICGSLLLYVVWAIVSWPLHLAPLLAMQQNLGSWAALCAAIRSTAVRGKLIEVNLVMHIVKIAALVLALVFSASPLPFTSVETQTFLNAWWSGVLLLYFAASDYFHVVRSAAYISLWRSFDPPAVQQR